MKLNKLEFAGVFAALALVVLAMIFVLTQSVAYAQQIPEACDIIESIPGMDCDEDGDTGVPVDACDITPCDEGDGGSMAEQINCEIYRQLMAAGDPIPQGFDANGCDDDENGEGGGGGNSPACSDGNDNDNDGKIDMEDPGCTDGNDSDETDPSSGGGGGGSSGGGSSGGSSGGGGGGGGGGSGGAVLGATSGGSCHYLTGFIKEGANNDREQVLKLQAFLKVFEGANVELSGEYDSSSVQAVHAFQAKYASDILAPWGTNQSTGYVYLTTRKKINEIYCDRGQTFPLTESELQIIEHTKTVASTAAVHATTPATSQETTATNTAETVREVPVVEERGNAFINFFRRLFDRFR